jgi:hypothetical protein
MKRDGLIQLALGALAGALILYAFTYYLIEHLRTRRGGWQVTFQSDAAGAPSLAVAQPKLGIDGVHFHFPDERIGHTNLAQTIIFDQPITNVPFGNVVYLDTTFLPGSVVLDLFGHQIQLLPRVLLVDRQEIPWRSAAAFRLQEKAAGQQAAQEEYRP